MPREFSPKISQLVGAMTIVSTDCESRVAKNGEELLPGEKLVPGKNSSCIVRINGRIYATISKLKAAEPAKVCTAHPFAPRSAGSKRHLKATCLKTGGLLIFQAQREAANEVHAFSLIVQP